MFRLVSYTYANSSEYIALCCLSCVSCVWCWCAVNLCCDWFFCGYCYYQWTFKMFG